MKDSLLSQCSWISANSCIHWLLPCSALTTVTCTNFLIQFVWVPKNFHFCLMADILQEGRAFGHGWSYSNSCLRKFCSMVSSSTSFQSKSVPASRLLRQEGYLTAPVDNCLVISSTSCFNSFWHQSPSIWTPCQCWYQWAKKVAIVSASPIQGSQWSALQLLQRFPELLVADNSFWPLSAATASC